MWNDDNDVLDWVNLPSGIVPESLWDSLHDADLVSVQSDLLARTVTLTFFSSYLIKFHDLPPKLRFYLRLDGVESVRVSFKELWPGGFLIPEGASRDEENRLIAEYRAKWREESASWADFERLLSRETHPPFVSDARMAVGKNGEFTLQLGIRMKNEEYFELCLRAEKLTVLRSDNEHIDLAQFKKLGEEYWTAFAARKQK